MNEKFLKLMIDIKLEVYVVYGIRYVVNIKENYLLLFFLIFRNLEIKRR